MTGSRGVVVVGMVALLLAGCAGGDPGPGGSPGSGGGDEAPVAAPALGVDCAGLAGEAALADAFGSDLAEIPLSFDGSGTYYVLSQIGLAQAGAVRCEWSDGGASGPEKYLTLSVLPDAADDWAANVAEVAAFQPAKNAFGDASQHQCTDFGGRLSCRVDVLAGGRWLSAVLSGPASEDAAGALIRGALDALAGVPDGDLPRPGSAPSCDALASDADVSAALGGDVALTANPGPVQPVLYHAGFLAAGGTHCYWRGSFSAKALAAHAGILPGGAAAWDDYVAREVSARVDREAVSGLGDAAFAGCVGETSCFAMARVGDVWAAVDVTSEAEPDSRARAIDLLRVLVAGL